MVLIGTAAGELCFGMINRESAEIPIRLRAFLRT